MAETSRTRPQPAGGLPAEGRARAVIDSVWPSIDGGRFAIKRAAGETVTVRADCFADGHDVPRVMLRHRREGEPDWREVEMTPSGNDRWRGEFVAGEPGRYRYTVCAWVDHFLSWRTEFARREDPADIAIAARVGAQLARAAATRATGGDRERLERHAALLESDRPVQALREAGLDEPFRELALRHPDRSLQVDWPFELPLAVDRERARFSSWYELFPRSASAQPGRHGTLRDVQARLPHVAEMGFDVLYLPPIHPIGRVARKGRNNALVAGPDDVGSPWAIGSREGGHKSVHPQLGTIDDFRALMASARELGVELAMDIAFQCAPDHPYVSEHPDWFRRRPDGSVQYAENPPKKYQDIYPFDFECADWRGLWRELSSVFEFWIGEGVRIFRVDNPHTKSFAFWEWVIDDLSRRHPELVFLAEAFTRPGPMHRLAKLGFNQSYTYFAWRNTRRELTEYMLELAHGPGSEYLRPNAWPNTPDILTEALQYGGRAAFVSRLVLAATLCANYGIYGPAYELMESTAREPGSEEYVDSEKYQLRQWDLERSSSLRPLIALLNRIRRENPALQSDRSLRFFDTGNEQLICYAKATPDQRNVIVTVVNLDPHHAHAGWVELDPGAIGVEQAGAFQLHDLLTGARYLWQGGRGYVSLDPQRVPAHVFRVRRRVRSERDFDYFL